MADVFIRLEQKFGIAPSSNAAKLYIQTNKDVDMFCPSHVSSVQVVLIRKYAVVNRITVPLLCRNYIPILLPHTSVLSN